MIKSGNELISTVQKLSTDVQKRPPSWRNSIDLTQISALQIGSVTLPIVWRNETLPIMLLSFSALSVVNTVRDESVTALFRSPPLKIKDFSDCTMDHSIPTSPPFREL
jgi:hypothetical protein